LKTSLSAKALGGPLARLERANAAFLRLVPGDSPARQPVHTLYGGAQLFRADSVRKLGELARQALREHAPDAHVLGDAFALPRELAQKVYPRVLAKLEREPVEDFRIDFEDGYGVRPDAEEDACAEAAARETARGLKGGTLPPFIGIRIKPFTGELYRRSWRTLDLFISTLVQESGGRLPANFVVTLPKVMDSRQVAALADLFDVLEARLNLARGALKLELMIETPQSILDADGRSNLPSLVDAAGASAEGGRCIGAHFGVYDYTASCGITAQFQNMGHPACDFARHMMQVALAGRGLMLSDGATNIMPVPPHKSAPGATLPAQQQKENMLAVHGAWRMHYNDVRHSLRHAFYQGWDLNPAQLPTRYAAVYAFFLESLESAAARLRNFVEQAAKATLAGNVFDDAATGQGLLNFFLRGLNCGALTEAEAQATGLMLEELRMRSFAKILEHRSGRS
jgi:citrate lyase beta subunit